MASKKRPAGRAKPTSYDRALPTFEPALLNTPEGAKKATAALRSLRKKPVDDDRWTDLCIALVDLNGRYIRRMAIGYRPELSSLTLEAGRALQHIDDPESAHKLLALLQLPSPHEPQRALIVFLIGLSKRPDIVPPLLDWFRKQDKLGSDAVYREIADTLIRLANPAVVKTIKASIPLVRNGYHRWALEQALESIAKKKGPTHSLTYRVGPR
jgi:hypothetical protein